MSRRAFTFTAVLLTATLSRPAPAAAAACEDLSKISTPGMTVTAATVAAGAFKVPGEAGRGTGANPYATLPAFCRAMVTAKPSSDSDIKIEVWLPAAGWNGKFEAVGQGGLAGMIPYTDLAEALAGGYATAGTDTGHVGGNADFMPAHPEKLIDFGYRAIHEMAVVGKSVINAHYGKAPTHSYYNGCSGGGRHGITSAQRYPADFNAILAGASTWNQARLDSARIGINLLANKTPEHKIPASKYPMIHNAVLAACDALDGVKDGVLENPTKCNFNYASLVCKGADGPTCLTAPQVETANLLTTTFKDSATGAVLLEQHLWPGNELEWGGLGGSQQRDTSLQRVRNFHLKDPKYEFRLANIGEFVERATKMDGGILASNNYNLKPFFDRGGKLLMYHGWSDPQVPGQGSVIYYNNVLKTVGKQTDDSFVLMMIPGMLHCQGGPGTDTFDGVGAIAQWFEQGKRPARIVASHQTNGKVDKTRPLCAYPTVAKYNGSGSTDEAANFTCVADTVNLNAR